MKKISPGAVTAGEEGRKILAAGGLAGPVVVRKRSFSSVLAMNGLLPVTSRSYTHAQTDNYVLEYNFMNIVSFEQKGI